ncbi:MAG: hypothetical protein IJI97_00270 [Clostridia bacterium]|nr:hypothetical protein [Clostridia bacterium]
MRWTDESLTEYARTVIPSRFKEVRAELVPFSDFKVNWQKGYSWITFWVSDYLDEAPKYVMGDILLAAATEQGRESYSEQTKRWLLTRIRDKALGRYAERHGMHAGEHIDLGAFEAGGTAVMFGPLTTRDAGFSLLLDVIVINEEYDEPGREQEIAELISGQMQELGEAREIF